MEQKNKARDLLTIVIPAFKQAKTIKNDLSGILASLEEGINREMDYEVICVVDGDVDRTYSKASEIKSANLRVLRYKENRGKGFAVRYGMKRAKGNIISFLDAGMDISPKSIMMLLAHFRWYDADIIVGSKRHPVSQVNYPFFRKILSFGYHLGVKILFGIPLRDTQSGLKIFRREVVEKIVPRLLVKRYAMDIEMLAVARYLGFKRIYEAPIEVRFNKETSRIDWKTIFLMIWDTAAVFYRLYILHYYDEANRKNWLRS